MYEVSRDREILRPVQRCFDFPKPVKRTLEERIADIKLDYKLAEKGRSA
jgi:hypothetical protein